MDCILLGEQREINSCQQVSACPGSGCKPSFERRSFFWLDPKERTKEKIKAGEEMAKNFSAPLKQIKRPTFLRKSGDKYLFCRPFIIVLSNDAASRKAGLYASLRNFLNAISSHAALSHVDLLPQPNMGFSRGNAALLNSVPAHRSMLRPTGMILCETLSKKEAIGQMATELARRATEKSIWTFFLK